MCESTSQGKRAQALRNRRVAYDSSPLASSSSESDEPLPDITASSPSSTGLGAGGGAGTGNAAGSSGKERLRLRRWRAGLRPRTGPNVTRRGLATAQPPARPPGPCPPHQQHAPCEVLDLPPQERAGAVALRHRVRKGQEQQVQELGQLPSRDVASGESRRRTGQVRAKVRRGHGSDTGERTNRQANKQSNQALRRHGRAPTFSASGRRERPSHSVESRLARSAKQHTHTRSPAKPGR